MGHERRRWRRLGVSHADDRNCRQHNENSLTKMHPKHSFPGTLYHVCAIGGSARLSGSGRASERRGNTDLAGQHQPDTGCADATPMPITSHTAASMKWECTSPTWLNKPARVFDPNLQRKRYKIRHFGRFMSPYLVPSSSS